MAQAAPDIGVASAKAFGSDNALKLNAPDAAIDEDDLKKVTDHNLITMFT